MSNSMSGFEINSNKIGEGNSTYIIAELSANHDNSLGFAREGVRQAKEAGADAVKVQTYTPDTMTIDSEKEHFRIDQGTQWDGTTLYELYEEAYMPWEWQEELKEAAEDVGVDFFSTAFDPSAVDFLEELDVPVHKIASFEITDIPLIEKMASTGKPIIISTGMADLCEIQEAVETAKTGTDQVALLKCSSAYPASPGEMNLRTIPHMREAFDVPVGLSDHSLGVGVSVAAVAMGASIVEKHFTPDRSVETPDSSFSLEPEEFGRMVEAVWKAEAAMGEVEYGPGPGEEASRVFRRSLFTVKDIKEGEAFTEENVRPIRPGYGMKPKHLDDILGKEARRDIDRGTPLSWDLVL